LPGDLLIALTDGYVEAKSPAGVQFGTERMLGIIREHRTRPASAIIEVLKDAVHTFSGSCGQADDLTAVIVRRTA
jgi:sigma-B regulation protein RsbU (phosphoserine phosphatase)